MSASLKQVYPQPDDNRAKEHQPRIDIIFVHGLNPLNREGHSENTWQYGNVVWPRDLLCQKVPDSRIFMFEYNSNVAFDASEAGIREHANSLLDHLQGHREDTGTIDTPIIFVGHSLGGLVIKQALVLAKQNDRVYGDLRAATKAIAFFATPHKGGNGASLGERAANIVRFFQGNLRNDLLRMLKEDSKHLANLTADFAHQYEDYQFLTISETLGMAKKGPIRTIVVDSSSSIIGLAGHREHRMELNRDHRQICKFESASNPDYVRVVRQLKRLADAASRPHPTQDQPVEHRIQSPGSDEAATNLMHTVKLKILDSPVQSLFVGQLSAISRLESFMKDKSKDCLVVTGPVGSGKSALVRKFAFDQQSFCSVIWLSAESSGTLQASLEVLKASISSGIHAPTARTPFRDWLLKQDVPWLVIFDNAYDGFQFSDLFPRNKGKVIITSRRRPDVPDVLTTSLEVDPLTSLESCSLFTETWQQQRRGALVPQPRLILPDYVLSAFQGRPLVVVLSATQLALICQDWHSTVAQLCALVEETAPGSPDLDPLIWKWVWLTLEELSPSEMHFIGLFIVLGSAAIPVELFDSTEYRSLLPRITRYGLLRTYTRISKSYLSIPLEIRDCLYRSLESQSGDSHQAIIYEATDLLHTVVAVTSKADDTASRKDLVLALSQFQQICLCANRFGVAPNRAMTHLAQILSACTLKDAGSLLSLCCYNHYWKIWLTNNDFGFPDHITADDDESQYIEPPTLPSSWISSELNNNSGSVRHIYAHLEKALAGFHQEDLTTSLLLGAVGHCWHGIREEVFGFVKELPGAPRDQSRIEAFNDAIEQGATSGLMNVARDVSKILGDDKEFSKRGNRHLGHAVSVLTASLSECYAGEAFDDGDLQSAISTTLKTYHLRGMGVIGHGFLGTFRGTTSVILCTVIESSFPKGSAPNPESLQSPAAFVVAQCSSDVLEERSRKMAKGYWEVFEGAYIFIIAQILTEVSSILPDEKLPSKQALLRKAMNIIQEGIIQLEYKRTPLWRSTLRQAAFRCELAMQFLTAWNPDSNGPESKGQQRWMETCIYLNNDDIHQPVDWYV